MDTQSRQVDPAQMEALQRQMAGAFANQNPTPTQTPVPNQVTSPVGAPAASATSDMRARMRAARGEAPPPPTVVTQGDTYNPQPTTQPVQPTQPQNGATSTIINTTNTGGSGDDGGQDKEKKKFNPVIAVGIFIGFAVLLVILMVFSKKPEDAGNAGDNPVTDNPIEDDLVWIDPITDANTFYTPEQIAKLREVGYTGDEIEQFATFGEDVNAKIREAEAARDAWLQEAVAPLFDATSQEYKDFISQTWLTLPERKDLDEWTQVAGYYEERKNLDYEKVTTYGNQLFIKIYLDDDNHTDWFFLNVTPEEWIKLKEKGNVIVTYTYCTRYITSADGFNVEDFDNTFITGAALEIIE